MKIAIADVNVDGLNKTAKDVAVVVGETNVIAIPTDVSQLDQVVRLRDRVYEAWGEVSEQQSYSAPLRPCSRVSATAPSPQPNGRDQRAGYVDLQGMHTLSVRISYFRARDRHRRCRMRLARRVLNSSKHARRLQLIIQTNPHSFAPSFSPPTLPSFALLDSPYM